MTDATLERVRKLCLALPEVNERPSHGMPTWFVRDKKTFVTYADNHHHDGILGLWCHAPEGVQEMLLDTDPHRFFYPPYVGHRGWVGVHLDRDPDWDHLATIIEDAWRMVAPKSLIALLDAREADQASRKGSDE